MKRVVHALGNRRGQAAVEFIVVAVVVFFFLFFFLSLSMVAVLSEYMDYATFMAARTYRSGYGTPNAQEAFAKNVFQGYASKISGMAENVDLKIGQTAAGDRTTEGVVAQYDVSLFYLPPIFVAGTKFSSKIRLTSESYLGREPTAQECFGFFENFAQSLSLGISGTRALKGMDDNGC